MKKLIVGLGVLVVFVAYSLWVRHDVPMIQLASQVATVQPPSQTNTTSPAPSAPSTTPSSTAPTAPQSAAYKDGTYTGSTDDATYGSVQVAAVIAGGKITDVSVLQYPDTHTDSIAINQQALPLLKQEAIQAQNANVQIISGATFTSEAYIQSLRDALNQAQNS